MFGKVPENAPENSGSDSEQTGQSKKSYQQPGIEWEANLQDLSAEQAKFVAQAMAASFKGERAQTKRAETAEKEATTDTLTGLSNLALFNQRFAILKEKKDQQRQNEITNIGTRRTDKPDEEPTFSLIIIDIDKFKGFNDEFGHQVGNIVLEELAKLLGSEKFADENTKPAISKRSPLDTVARYGGEEFAILLEDVNGEQAEVIAERIRAAVEANLSAAVKKHSQRDDIPDSITISLGVAGYDQPMSTKDLFHSADKALYYVKKQGGRNGVKNWTNPTVQAWSEKYYQVRDQGGQPPNKDKDAA